MTPGARIAAAIEILDEIATGKPAEQALTQWARRSRFAGSKDRAAIRDHVFDVLRCYRSAAHYGQGCDGRALMIGLCHLTDTPPDQLFTGEGHAPAPLTQSEKTRVAAPDALGVLWNLPDWLVPLFQESLGSRAAATATFLQARGPVGLRVNLLKCDLDQALARLSSEGIVAQPVSLARTALQVTEGARRLRQSESYKDGWVELQDTASQAVVESLPSGGKVLDYCAGGGGKALALAADPTRVVHAHDIDPRRMADLPARAARAGAQITQVTQTMIHQQAPYDVVLCDAPCSGSGAWRRAPEGKRALTAGRLAELCDTQDAILDSAASRVASGGLLVYATCSVLACENEARRAAFLARHPDWASPFARRLDISDVNDGFYTAHFMRR